MGFWSSVRGYLLGEEPEVESRGLLDIYNQLGGDSHFTFNGNSYPLLNQTWSSTPGEEPPSGELHNIVEYVYRRNGVAAAAMFIRMAVFSEARFVFRRRFGGRPGELWGNESLAVLEGPGGGSGGLLSRMLNDADLVGNAFVARRGDRLVRLRPDWVTIVLGVPVGADDMTEDPRENIDAEVVAYLFHPGGQASGRDPVPLFPETVAHFAPIPDPLSAYRGMSWLTPVLREVAGDNLATTHKTKFFQNAATPNMVVTLDISDVDVFRAFVQEFEKEHKGASNAYKTLFFGAGAEAKPVGSSFREMDFRSTIGVSEARIAMAAGVPPTILGTTEGLQGSSLNAGNYGQSRRRFADGTMRPLWRQACASLEHLVDVPPGSQLWYDASDIPFLQEDQKDEADIRSADAATIRQLTDGGFEPGSVIEAIAANDMSRLKHTGLLSVQLQNPKNTTDSDEEIQDE
jgi:hypothetical protein